MCKKNKTCAIKCVIKPGDELGDDGDRSLWARPGGFRMRNGEYIRTPSIRDLMSRVIELAEKGVQPIALNRILCDNMFAFYAKKCYFITDHTGGFVKVLVGSTAHTVSW